MNAFARTLVTISAVWGFSAVALAEDMQPLEAKSYDLISHTAVVYYVESGDGYEVVTTLGPNLGYTGPITQQRTKIQRGQVFSLVFDTESMVPGIKLVFDTRGSGFQMATLPADLRTPIVTQKEDREE